MNLISLAGYTFLVSCFSYHGKNPEPSNISNGGDTIYLHNTSNRSLFLNYHDEMIWGNPTLVKPGSTYRIVPDSSCRNPLILINSDVNQIPFLVNSKQTKVDIKFLSDKSNSVEMTSGSSVQENTELNYFNMVFKETGPLQAEFFLRRENPKINDGTYIDIYKKRMAILNMSLHNKEVSENFYFNCKIIFTSYLIHSLTLPNTVTADHYKYLDSIAKDLFKGKIVQLLQYKQAILDYYSFLITRFKQTGPDDIFLNNYFSTDSKDFLLTKLLYDKLRLTKKLDQHQFATFTNECTNKKYRTTIDSLINSFRYPEKIDLHNEMAISYGGEKIKLDSFFSSHPQNIYVLDLWASWCIPCRKEFKYALPLIKQLKGSKIIYTFVSTDQNIKAWKEAVNNEGLATYVNNFVIPDAQHSPLLNKLKLSTIPRYVLLDSKGTILNGDFPRPSTPNTFDLLKKYMN